jgi:aldehyde dehydrogenase (NAD+)
MSAEVIRSWSPQAPDDLIAEAPEADACLVAEFAERAREAQRSWWSIGASGRAAALTAAAGDLRGQRQQAMNLVVREVGKPLDEAAGEVARAIAILEYYAQACYFPRGETFPPSATGNGLLFTERRPHGVAGLITPWNFPLAIPLWKAAPALAAGNAVLLKPSPEAIGCAQFLAARLASHLPEGLFVTIAGGASAGESVVREADVISFTGSVAIGRAVAAAAVRRAVPVQCELGGHNAAIVLPDADAARTAAMIAGAAMGYAGQKCTATRRVIVIGENALFTEALAEAVTALRPADPAASRVLVGPVISAAARARVVAAIKAADEAGGRLMAGGALPDAPGWFIEPALIGGVPADHPLLHDETFGPLTIICSADSLDDAISMANGVRFGLVTSVHGRDVDALLAAAARVDSGMVKINGPTTGVDFYAPFGGEKDSSYGPREQGMVALDFYTSTRTISFSPHAG